MRIIIFLLWILPICIFASDARDYFVKSGKLYVYWHNNGQNHTKLIYFKNAHDFALSPNGHWLAFVKKNNHKTVKKCTDYASINAYGDEIWIINLIQMKKRLLVRNQYSCDDMSKVIINPNHLKFSPDSKTLYFETSAWDTSDAIHMVDVDGSHLKFVTDGNEYRVVQNGKYKGDLIVNQHRYRFDGDTPLGSYDWDWLYTPGGKQIKLYKKIN